MRRITDRVIAEELMGSGYVLTQPSGAQRILAYAIGIEGQLSDEELVDIFGISAGIDDYRNDTLRGGIVMVLLDARTQRVIWRGSASGISRDGTRNVPQLEQAIRRGVRSILQGETVPRQRGNL